MPAIDTEFLAQHPDLKTVDLLLPDMNGVLRGKRIESSGLGKVFTDGIALPASLFGTDITGETAEGSGLGFDIGDMDYVCHPVPGTLARVAWSPDHEAQLLLAMSDAGGDIFAANPRVVLQRAVERLNRLGLYPTVAVELEFYLLDPNLDDQGMPRSPVNPVTGRVESSTQVYSIDDLDSYKAFVDRVQEMARIQNIPASTAVAEYAPGQFEINLHHRDNALAACDDAIMLRRLIKAAAAQEDFVASFMAKPFAGLAGSGTHIHASLYDEQGQNAFAGDESLLRFAIAGMQGGLKDAMLVFAPHANSYRRFQSESYVPLNAAWGYNNRTVALRVPSGPRRARRIEHRVAGADANPYLVTAAVLAGMASGIEARRDCDDPVTGNAYKKTRPDIPTDWLAAIDRFRASPWIGAQFGEEFQHIFAALKQTEYDKFQAHITPLEVQWCLRI